MNVATSFLVLPPMPPHLITRFPVPWRNARMANILVVDDDPLIIILVKRKLTDAGYTVHVAEDGQKALSVIASVHIDVVITDVVMPVLDGWAFIRELRMRPECAFLP